MCRRLVEAHRHPRAAVTTTAGRSSCRGFMVVSSFRPHYEPGTTCGVIGYSRFCVPNYDECCRLCGINHLGVPLVFGVVCWQHELTCLPMHGIPLHRRMPR